jgi:hypothetical protein
MLFAALFAGGSQSAVKPAAASSGTFVEDEPTSQMACPRSGDSPNSIVPAQQRAATTQTPAEAHRRWRGERSEPVRLGVRSHTHALFAREVQRKLSNGIAGFAALGSWRQATAALARTRPQHHSHDVFGNARRLEHHRSAMRPVVVPVLAAMAGPITPSMSSTTACSVAATGVPRERAAATNAAITRQCQSAVNRQAEAAVRAERMDPLPNHDLLQLRRIVYPNFAPVPRWPLTESGPEWVAASQRFWAVRQSSPLRLRAAGIEREPDRNGLPARVFQPALSPSSYCFLGSRSPGPEQSSVIQLGLSTSIQQTCSVKQRVLIS